MRRAIFPGSFDPITFGHIDIIQRAAPLFDELIVAVLVNPDKHAAFSTERREELIRQVLPPLNVRVTHFDGLLMDYAAVCKAQAVVRGLRAVSDFEYEFQMAQLNRQLNPTVETLFMMTAPQFAYISSSMVRQIATLGGDISALVPAGIIPAVQAACRR